MKNTIKNLIILVATVFTSNQIIAQNGNISLFHLGDYVHQTSNVSPVYIPKNSFSLGLPGLSGVSAQLNNGFKATDLLIESGNDLELDFLNLYNTLESDYNELNQSLSVNLLSLAFKRKHGSISFFVNAKENINWQMSKNGFINLMANGITQDAQTILIDDQINSTAYIEGGIGFTQQFLNDKLAIGVRLKYLIGLANGSTEEDGYASLDVNNNYTWTINSNNAIAKVAGVDPENTEDYEFSTKNSGFGFDIGATYEILPNLEIEVAVNDIGSITWKENVKEYYIEDSNNVTVDGVNLDSDDDLLDDLEDKLNQDIITGEREGSSYTTSLATNSYASLSYKLKNIHQFRATLFNNHTIEDAESIIALGYNIALKKTTYGVVGIKNAHGDLDFGLNIATKLGPLQLYVVSDNVNQILALRPEEKKNINVQFGVNFVFGYNKWFEKK